MGVGLTRESNSVYYEGNYIKNTFENGSVEYGNFSVQGYCINQYKTAEISYDYINEHNRKVAVRCVD